MAITYNLPIGEWYFDSTSEWTLDYPPLFAAFEFLLALIAHQLNLQDILELTDTKIRNHSVVVYQKSTVIVSDFVYYYAVYKLCKAIQQAIFDSEPNQTKKPIAPENVVNYTYIRPSVVSQQNLLDALHAPDSSSAIALLLLLQPGLLLVDHIHFQYNGLLTGILILSLANMIDGNQLFGAFWFAVLLNFKHIYLYCAPAIGLYLLTGYCFQKQSDRHILLTSASRFIKLGIIVIGVFAITFTPFANESTLKQIVTRLFPFKRGLTHAYWAPNVWALYNTADKILGVVYKDSLVARFDFDTLSGIKSASSTSGLVQEYEHVFLPSIKPITTFALVGFFTLPLVMKFLIVGRRISPGVFLEGVTMACFTSYMFGWHVHEKAIIMTLIPLIPLFLIYPDLRRIFLRMTLLGTYSLFPLLYQTDEYIVKVSLLLTYLYIANSIKCIPKLTTTQPSQQPTPMKGFVATLMRKLYDSMDVCFILGVISIELYSTLVHGRYNHTWNPLAKLNKYEFLPLMLTSFLCATGITFSYLELYYLFCFGRRFRG